MVVNQLLQNRSREKTSTHVRIDIKLYREIKLNAIKLGLPIKKFIETCIVDQLQVLGNNFISTHFKEGINENQEK